MNAKEIVRALETEVLCENCPHNESNCPDDGCYYIMAAALIDKLQALAENGQSAIDTNMRLVKVVESLQAQLAAKDAEIERLREAQRWVPVTERLPNNKQDDWVLAQITESNGYMWIPKVVEYREVKNDWYCEELGWLKDHKGLFAVTHWMALPAAPEEGAEL